MIVIPAIDLLNNSVVRLSQGDYGKVTSYSENPVSKAIEFEQQGFTRLHLVDLEGARSGRVVHLNVLKQIARETGLKIDFGGGIKTEAELNQAFESGAEKVNIGSLAIKNPELFVSWLNKYGSDRFILSADVLNGIIRINGWTEATQITINQILEMFIPKGLKYLTCTDISKDGMMTGPSTDLYQNIAAKFPELHITASGGVSGIPDLVELKMSGCHAAVAGKSLLEGKITAGEILSQGLSL
jgi:phosphoribosylformimino-5-aminoimidazole carboxamide ribotide isomerase